ncbi:copper amine oxidase N-terminal domain-containing protein [Paenibacillus sp. OV219]|uniref:copper amine oxidase N-terminal domain-containing protein n=1 Tax=Paenibacillus sp. OV219 TaxID=1884377 RepID=UPI0008D1725E|nr:copper amine oxidase N-terminal domain-containing protein [Paenibacillus sp. OV219]SEN58663.1 Copper amine oxidase N-terminal domain-containing protein [Paenibacillus sp. OV219]
MKKIITLTAALSLLAASSVANASTTRHIIVNDQSVSSSSDFTPIVENGRALVPLRVVADALDASVAWDAKSRTASVRKWSDSIVFKAGSKTATAVYGNVSPDPQTVALDTEVIVRRDRVYVPLRMIAHSLGYLVDLRGNGSILLQSPLSRSDRELLATGKLSDARMFVKTKGVMNARYANIPTMYPSEGREGFAATFLFPAGEANRFFLVAGDTAAFYELKGGFFVITWRALIPLGNKDELRLFMDRMFTKATGKYPADLVGKIFFYFTNSSIVTSERREAGQIAADGTITRLGIKWTIGEEVKEQSGSLALVAPDETRNEVRLP